ncbi:kinase-like protein [Fomitiporia mediterranea MF3/22]|uniref:kinase-like protein n=1 Tax=Fomitiporia mediterranea (strain MF3/22) TaxID=694068 RepID=UPI0004408227|nr:kinase-like protein [Fomitiporia mediterranea MF3/22]EJD04881.1 kinase-like protein [Fomitiporia mediterranea MF3/22]
MSESEWPFVLKDLVPLIQDKSTSQKVDPNWTCAKHSKDNYMPRQLKLIGDIGKGSFARVFLNERDDLIEDGRPKKFAAKVVFKEMNPRGYEWIKAKKYDEKKEAWRSARNEAKILGRLKHEQVINYFGAFENKICWVIILDYARGGNLDDRLRRAKQFSEPVTAHYLRPGNFLIKDAYSHSSDPTKDNLLLSNFGCNSPSAVHSKDNMVWNVCGSNGFVAPEITRLSDSEQKWYTETVDIWSLGSTAFTLLTGRLVTEEIPEHAIPTTLPVSRDIEIAQAITNDHIEKYILPKLPHGISKKDHLQNPFWKMGLESRLLTYD